MRSLTLLAGAVCLALTGCTLRPTSQTLTHRIDSVQLSGELAGTAQASPFCLHLRLDNRFWVVYSQHVVAASVTAGRCDQAGAPLVVDGLVISWQPDWHDTRQHKSCTDTSTCTVEARDVVAGQHLVCASARARLGNQVAMLSTNTSRCP